MVISDGVREVTKQIAQKRMLTDRLLGRGEREKEEAATRLDVEDEVHVGLD